MASSLSSVVSDLVRTQMTAASSKSANEQDDLDRHVAELIVREAKKKAEMYLQNGIRAYTTNNLSDSNVPRANKRFLSSIIKSTDEHNRTILKAQAQAAEELKRERREQERRQRRLRAEEAAAAEKQRRKGKQRKVDDADGWDRWDGRTAQRERVSRDWETWDGHDDQDKSQRKSQRKRHRSRSPEHRKATSLRVKGDDDDDDRDREVAASTRHRRRHHSSSPRRHDAATSSTRKRSLHLTETRSPSTDTEHRKSKRRRRIPKKYALDDLFDPPAPEPRDSSSLVSMPEPREAELGREGEPSAKLRRDSKQASPSPADPSSSRRSLTPMTISRSPTPGPRPTERVPSKMDRYFEESYDPRLDTQPLTVPQVPATGLINNADFEGWDAMLDLIRLRREDKAEKKRLERLGLLPPKDKKKGVVLNSSAAVAERWNDEGASVMDIAYSKKGTIREWDLGKEGLS